MAATLAVQTGPSLTFSETLSGWLKVWTRLFQRSPMDGIDEKAKREVVAAYAGVLDGLTPEQLDAACRLTTRTCKFFPTPAEIFCHVEQADAAGLDLEAGDAWDSALEYARKWYLPDMGLDRRAPELPANVEHAIRAAGGLRFLESCSEDDLIWARKRFLEAFGRADELQRDGRLLTRTEAKRLLANLHQASRPRVLPASVANDDEPHQNPGLTAVRDAFAEVAARSPAPEPKSAERTRLRFPADPDHEGKVRRQAAEIRAKAGPQG